MKTPDETPDEEPAEEAASLVPLDHNTQRINLSGDTVVKATADLGDDERRLLRWAFDYAKTQGWAWRESERFFKLSSTTLYRVWTDKYRQQDFYYEGKGADRVKLPNPKAGERIALTKVCEAIAKSKRIADARGGVEKLPFIETSVWRRVEKVADEVLTSQCVGFIFGESQIGKTRCIEEYARRNNHGQTLLVTMPPAAGVQLMCKEIGRALHIGESAFDKTYTRIIDALDGERLLIIDEAHMIFETYQRNSVKRCLATLRHIHDRSKCGLLICATDVFATEAKNSEFRNTMKQFFRRSPFTLQLGTQAPWEDILAITSFYKLPAPERDVEDALRVIAREDGLGKLTKFLAGAARMAAKKDQPLSWSHFQRYVGIIERMALPVKEEP